MFAASRRSSRPRGPLYPRRLQPHVIAVRVALRDTSHRGLIAKECIQADWAVSSPVMSTYELPVAVQIVINLGQLEPGRGVVTLFSRPVGAKALGDIR